MIEFIYSESVFFRLKPSSYYKERLKKIIESEKKRPGDIVFSFFSDEELLQLNKEFLNHDYYTDVITFDYSSGKEISADVCVSAERIKENAKIFKTSFSEELLRVLLHSILHCCGYKDKTDLDKKIMREKELEKIKMFHEEHEAF